MEHIVLSSLSYPGIFRYYICIMASVIAFVLFLSCPV